jgi:large subunit ribosomal protein L29
MKLSEIRQELEGFRAGDEGKIKDDLAGLKKEQFNLRFQQATGQMQNTARPRQVRRMIARANTVLSEKAKAKKD